MREFVIVGDIKTISKDVKVIAKYKDSVNNFEDRFLFTAKIQERDYYEPFGEEDYRLLNTFYAPVTIIDNKFETAYCNNFNEFVVEVLD